MEGSAAKRAARTACTWLAMLALLGIAPLAGATPRPSVRMRALEQAARADSLAEAARPATARLGVDASSDEPGCPDFIEPDSYALAGWAFGTAVADFDGDGRPDVAVADIDDSVRVFPNLGDGRLGVPRGCPALRQSVVGAADLDGDGRPDLVTAGNTIQVLLNAGDGSFLLDSTYARRWPQSYWVPPVFADLDGDGRLDFMLPSADTSLVIHLNDGAGRFRRTWALDLPGRPDLIGVADLDGDGRPDVVARSQSWSSRTLSVLMNRGGGVFERRDEPGDGAPFALGDFDEDGVPDLVLGRSEGGAGPRFRRGRGDGTFDPPVAAGEAPELEALSVADMDGDGHADLVGSSRWGDVPIVVMPGDGRGNFRRLDGYAFGAAASVPTVADLDGDGLPEVVVGDDQQRLRVGRNRGAGRLAANNRELVGDFPSAVVAADLDGDGTADLATVTYLDSRVHGLRSRGDGTFEPPFVVSSPTFPVAIAAADVTADGLADLVTLSADDPSDILALQVNQGGGRFRAGQRINLLDYGYRPEAVAAADFDRDGAVDLALAGYPAPALMRNFVIGPFRAPVLLPGAACDAVAVGDFNADGWPDLATSSYGGRVWVLLNDGHGGFPDTAGYACPQTVSLAVADLDGDGRDDLAVGSVYEPTVSVFTSAPDGALRAVRTLAVPAANCATVAAPRPRPGAAADLVVAAATWRNGPGTVVRLRNDGSGDFSETCVTSVGMGVNGLAVADFDGNGALDLAFSHGREGADSRYLTVALGARPDPRAVTTLALLEASARPDRVRLAWQGNGALTVGRLYRRAPGEGWARYAALAPDAAGRLVFEDANVRPGARYGYRVSLDWDPVERIAGEAEVTVPLFGFGLAGVRPAPVRDAAARVAFVLSGEGAARLQVFDVAGRVVSARALAGLGPGPHEVPLDAGPHLAPGVYLVRLSEGGRSASARAVVVR
jgi:hypothetical protein